MDDHPVKTLRVSTDPLAFGRSISIHDQRDRLRSSRRPPLIPRLARACFSTSIKLPPHQTRQAPHEEREHQREEHVYRPINVGHRLHQDIEGRRGHSGRDRRSAGDHRPRKERYGKSRFLHAAGDEEPEELAEGDRGDHPSPLQHHSRLPHPRHALPHGRQGRHRATRAPEVCGEDGHRRNRKACAAIGP